MSLPKVSIIILNWNGLEDTIECLESLKKITYPNYEVILVDNGSEGNDVQVLEEKFRDYIYLIKNDKNYGYCVANNMAIKYALNNSNPDYLLLLNNDTVVDPEFLTEMVKVAEADPAIGMAGAKFYYYDEPGKIQFVGANFNPWLGDVGGTVTGVRRILLPKECDKGQYDYDREVDVVAGWCELISSKVINKVGLLNEDFVYGWEEVDYCLNAKRAGFRVVYAHKAKVWHKWRTTAVTDGRLQYEATRLRFALLRRHVTKLQYFSFLAFFFGVHFWLATAYYLLWCRKPRVLLRFYKGVRDGLFHP